MAKTKPDQRSIRNKKNKQQKLKANAELSPENAQPLLDHAAQLLQQGEPDDALKSAKTALECLKLPGVEPISALPALEFVGEVYIELGDADNARDYFTQAAALDPDAKLTDDEGGGADKFLWLAQLCEEGGQESIDWFLKGITVLKRELEQAQATGSDEARDMSSRKLANALCGAAEVYMTDLSWEDDAEARCEAFVTEACLAAPKTPEPLQTLASVRISQTRMAEARAALTQSMELWNRLPPEDSTVPDFPTRVSLARLLMETGLEDKALDVLERLVNEDDHSVEAWYLGGWCLHLLAEKPSDTASEPKNHNPDDRLSNRAGLMKSSRDWLQNSLRLYGLLQYEDERLREHAEELVTELNAELGEQPDGSKDDDEDDEWEDEDGESSDQDEDEEMEGT